MEAQGGADVPICYGEISAIPDSVRPMHLFGHTFDHDYYFELQNKWEKMWSA
jgi:hypothetical protein